MNQITNYIIEEKEFDAACPEEKIMNSRLKHFSSLS